MPIPVAALVKIRPPGAGGAEQPGRNRERAAVHGLARDHAALAQFIKQLSSQPGVNEVRLLDTSARSYPNVEVVDFQLVAVLGAAAGAVP